jgi:hypothetical protein
MTFGYIAARHAAGVDRLRERRPRAVERRQLTDRARTCAPARGQLLHPGHEVVVRRPGARGGRGRVRRHRLRAENYWDAGLDDAAMLAIAAEHGVRSSRSSTSPPGAPPADRDEAQQRKEQTVFHMARAFGVRHLNAGLLEKLPLDVMTRRSPRSAGERAPT